MSGDPFLFVFKNYNSTTNYETIKCATICKTTLAAINLNFIQEHDDCMGEGADVGEGVLDTDGFDLFYAKFTKLCRTKCWKSEGVVEGVRGEVVKIGSNCILHAINKYVSIHTIGYKHQHQHI